MKIEKLATAKPGRVIGVYFACCFAIGMVVPAEIGDTQLVNLIVLNVPMFKALSICSFAPNLYKAFFAACSAAMLLAIPWMVVSVLHLSSGSETSSFDEPIRHPVREIKVVASVVAMSCLLYFLLIRPDASLIREMLQRPSLGERYGQTRDEAYKTMFSLGLTSRMGMSIFFSGLMAGILSCFSFAVLSCISYWRNSIQQKIQSKE